MKRWALLALLLVACQPVPPAPPARIGGGAIVVSEQGVRPTPRPCGAACQPEPTATPDGSFASFVATAAAMPTYPSELVTRVAATPPASTPAAPSPTVPAIDSSLLGSILGAPRAASMPRPTANPRVTPTATTGPPLRPTPPAPLTGR